VKIRVVLQKASEIGLKYVTSVVVYCYIKNHSQH